MRKFFLYSFLTLLTLVVLGVASAAYFLRNVKVSTAHKPGGDEVSVQTPLGEFHVRGKEKLDPAKLGVPIYPDAVRLKDPAQADVKTGTAADDVHFSGGATFEWNSADGRSDKLVSVAAAEYSTPDGVEKVRAWYHDHLPNWVVVTDRNGDKARFELHEGGYKRLVALREKKDGTRIAVASFGEPGSN